jgi:hypothetical protein
MAWCLIIQAHEPFFTDVLQHPCSYKRVEGWFGYYHKLCDSSESADSEKNRTLHDDYTYLVSWAVTNVECVNISVLDVYF